MYHSHHNATDQVGRGLLGAFIVEPRDAALRYDRLYGATQDIVWVSNDALGGFTINGRRNDEDERDQDRTGNAGEAPHQSTSAISDPQDTLGRHEQSRGNQREQGGEQEPYEAPYSAPPVRRTRRHRYRSAAIRTAAVPAATSSRAGWHRTACQRLAGHNQHRTPALFRHLGRHAAEDEAAKESPPM